MFRKRRDNEDFLILAKILQGKIKNLFTWCLLRRGAGEP